MQPPRRPFRPEGSLALLVAAATVLAFVGSGHAGRGPGLKPSKPPRPGDRCTHPGFSARYQGRVWSCERTGHGTVWVVSPAGSGSASSGGDPTTEQVVTANPFDLSQVRAISKFRSCSGHDYSGYDLQGHLETNRSMKHYVVPTPAALASPGAMDVYAPFAGTVEQIQSEQVPIGKQIWLDSADGRWQVRLFHTDPVVQQGQTLAAGALLGHPAFPTAVYGTSSFVSVDIALVYRGARVQGEVFDSFLAHATPAVAAQWAARGVTPADAIVPQAARDAAPCTGFDDYGPDAYVTLTP